MELSYSMPQDFRPLDGSALKTPVRVRVRSSSASGQFGQQGTVVFLHGAGGSADDYNKMWTGGKIPLPSGFSIVFVQSPREDAKWMLSSGTAGKTWAEQRETLNAQVHDDVSILKHVLYELQKEAGGYSKLWLCGRSQGACLSTLLAVAGVGPAVAGAFVIAATALPPLQDIPSGDIYSRPSPEKVQALRLGFYSGEKDDFFTGVSPHASGGTFTLLKDTLGKLGFFSGGPAGHFWIKQGASHSSIGPSEPKYNDGDAFKVLFAFIQKQDPTKAGVDGVRAWP